MRYNADLRAMMHTMNVQGKEIAKEFGITDSYVSHLLNNPLDAVKRKDLLDAIKRIGVPKLMAEKRELEERIEEINSALNAIEVYE